MVQSLLPTSGKKLNHLVADALEGEADNEEGEGASPAYQAREKLYQIYPHLRQSDMTAWNADSLLADPAASNRLDNEPTISGSDREDFGKKLEQFLSSCGGRAIWPLVKRLVDNPYLASDSEFCYQVCISAAHFQCFRLESLSSIYLVTETLTTSHPSAGLWMIDLSQIVVDGRIGEKSIALALTGTYIPFDEKGVEIDLATDITKLTTQIEVLKKRIKNGKPEKGEEWIKKGFRMDLFDTGNVTAKRQAREQRILHRNNLLVVCMPVVHYSE
ncbi:hypothetical protein B0H14DRAFT_2586231 [Mycena olivaceomarginata]|nr:hypothetical protein B0H14DRAFT_2586231 [Mycena olivaceomarginata]